MLTIDFEVEENEAVELEIDPRLEEAEEVEIEEAPPVFAVYAKVTHREDPSWELKLPLFTTEEDANQRRDDLLEISFDHGLMIDYEVRPLEVENSYKDARDFMYHEIHRETLGINR